MALKLPVASFRTTLTNKITSSATDIFVDSFTDDDGNSLTNGNQYGFIIDEGLSTEEFVIGTVDTANSKLTSCLRGISVTDGITEVAGNKEEHGKNATIKITAHPYLVDVIRVLNGTDAFGGVPSNPSSRTISDARHLVDKEYADLITAATLNAFVVSDNGGITINVGAGRLVTPDGTVDYAGDSNESLTDDSTNYVELDQTGTLSINTTGWTDGYVPLGEVTTVSGDITVVEDARGWLTIPSGDVLSTDDATYGATIAAGDLLFLDTADSKWKLADASAEATCDGQIGIALDAGADTDTNKRVQIGGLVGGLSGLTAGWTYVSDTAGDLAASAGTYKKVAGYAVSATQMFLIQVQSADELTGGNSDLTVANLNEAATFFANTDISAAEAETLTDGSEASALHYHDILKLWEEEQDQDSWVTFAPGNFDETLSVWTITNTGGQVNETPFDALVETNASANSDMIITSQDAYNAGNITPVSQRDWGNDMELVFTLDVPESTNQDLFFGIYGNAPAEIPANATSVVRHVGFFVEDGTLKASAADGATQDTPATIAATLTNRNVYKIVWTAGSQAEFYVNGTLEATLNTNIPSGTAQLPRLMFGVTNRTTSQRGFIIQNNMVWRIETSA